MLTEAQKQQIIDFVTHFLVVTHDMTNCTEEQAEIMAQLAISTLLAIIMRVPPPEDDTIDGIDKFVVAAIEVAVKRAYGKVALQA